MNHNSHIYYVYNTTLHSKHGLHDLPVAKFFLDGSSFSVLEDHGLGLHGLSPGKVTDKISRLARSQRFRVVDQHSLNQGKYTPHKSQDLDPGLTIPEKPKAKVSEFHYHREGMPTPQLLRLEGNKYFLDDIAVEPQEVEKIIQNVRTGKAKLRSPVTPPPLGKAEPSIDHFLKRINHPAEKQALTQGLFTDTLVPHAGNHLAYREFLASNPQGAFVFLHANDLGHLNDSHGFHTGDRAVAAIGKVVRDAANESVGKSAQVFRVGGPRFAVWTPSHQDAALLARNVRSKFDAIPAVRGTHRLSVLVGIGHTPDHSLMALEDSKVAKKQANYEPGQAKTHISSRHPDSVGVIS